MPEPKADLVQLGNRLKRGDEEAFCAVYDLYKSKLYWYVLKFAKSGDTTEEIVQDVFVKLWENRAALDPDLSLNAYLYTLAKHLVLNHLRKMALAASYAQDYRYTTEEASPQAEAALDYADYLERANQAIGKLPPKRQLIFQMSRQKDMSHEEIASELGISKNTVNVQLVKALKYIRTSLGLSTNVLAVLFLLAALL